MIDPLQILFVLANPAGLARFDDGRIWEEISDALDPLVGDGAIVVERLSNPTEGELRLALTQARRDILHIVAHAHQVAIAHYGAVALQRSDGTPREITATPLADLVAASVSVKLVVLQACDEQSQPATLAQELLENGVPAVAVVPAVRGRAARDLIAKLYRGVLTGRSAEDLTKDLAVGLPRDTTGGIEVVSPSPLQPILRASFPPIKEQGARTIDGFARKRRTSPHVRRLPVEKAWKDIIRQKTEERRFDVFLCHNAVDKPVVKRIGRRLIREGILPWLDEWELPAGQPWQPLLEAEIERIRSAAVFVGMAGLGPWQEFEMRSFLSEFIKRQVPVIPVLLPGVALAPSLPIFLRQMRWVDFRPNAPAALRSLISSIRGERPSGPLQSL